MRTFKRLSAAVITGLFLVPVGAGAAAEGDFSPTLKFALSDTRVRANPQMTIQVAQEDGEEELGHVTLKIPAGFNIPPDAKVPDGDQLGSGTINIAAGPGCRPGAPVGSAKAPLQAPATLREEDRTDEQADSGIRAVWILDISGVTNVPLEVRGSKATGFTFDGDIAPNDNTCPPFSFELKVNSQSASGVPILKNPRYTGRYKFLGTFTSADSPQTATIKQVIKITK